MLVLLVLLVVIAFFAVGGALETSSMNGQPGTAPKTGIIKSIYFYLVSLITLVIVIFATADLVNIGLKATIFTKADRVYDMPCPASPATTAPESEKERFLADCESQKRNALEDRAAQRERDLVRDIGLLVVAIPVFAWHYGTIRRESREEKEDAAALAKKQQIS